MPKPALILLAAAAIAAAASIENIPVDSRCYADFDLLKTSGFIRSMPSTSRPWTRREAVRLVVEAESLSLLGSPALSQRSALGRLLAEFADDLGRTGSRRPVLNIPLPDAPGSFRGDLSGRLRAVPDTGRFTLSALLNNRPGDDFCFYDRFDLSAWHPGIIEESVARSADSAGRHIPGMRVLPWEDFATLESEIAYLAFRLPWLRLEMGRDEFVWGPGLRSSVMLSDRAPSLDHIQFCASYRNFKFLSFTSLLSRWGTKPRFLSAQRAELSLWNRVTLAGALMGISSWDEIQPTQLGGIVNPLIPIYLTEANSGHSANLLVGWDVTAYLPGTKIYGQLFLDNYEFNVDRASPNAVGLQAGAYSAPNLPVELHIEYAAVTAFTYYHRVHSIIYENYITPLGHEIGPDADQLLCRLDFTPLAWLKFGLVTDYTRRGYHNRGDYLRKSFKDSTDTLYLRRHTEFPTRGWDTSAEPDTIIEEVERSLRVGPSFDVALGRDLHASCDLYYRAAKNRDGRIGISESGFDFALKVEYRY